MLSIIGQMARFSSVSQFVQARWYDVFETLIKLLKDTVLVMAKTHVAAPTCLDELPKDLQRNHSSRLFVCF